MGLVEFAAAGLAAAGPSEPIRASDAHQSGQVAGLSSLAASIMENQALSAVDRVPVASGSSPRAAQGPRNQRFSLPRRVFASFRTVAGDRRPAPAPAPAPHESAGGVRPPSPWPRAPYVRGAGHTPNLAKSSQQAGSCAAQSAPAVGRMRHKAADQARNISKKRLGSGVRGGLTRENARGSGRETDFFGSRVRDLWHSRLNLFPSKTGTLGRGRG